MATEIINKIIRLQFLRIQAIQVSFHKTWSATLQCPTAPIRLSEDLLPDFLGFSCEYLGGELWRSTGVVFKFFRLDIPSTSPWGSKPNLGLLVCQFFSIRPLHRLSCLCMWLLELGQCEKLSDTKFSRMGFEGQAFCKLLWSEWWWRWRGPFKLHQAMHKSGKWLRTHKHYITVLAIFVYLCENTLSR